MDFVVSSFVQVIGWPKFWTDCTLLWSLIIFLKWVLKTRSVNMCYWRLTWWKALNITSKDRQLGCTVFHTTNKNIFTKKSQQSAQQQSLFSKRQHSFLVMTCNAVMHHLWQNGFVTTALDDVFGGVTVVTLGMRQEQPANQNAETLLSWKLKNYGILFRLSFSNYWFYTYILVLYFMWFEKLINMVKCKWSI